MKKLICLLLCMLLALCPALVACEEAEEGGTSGGSSGGSASDASGSQGGSSLYTDENGRYTLDNLGMEFNFDEDEFRVCVYNSVVQTTYFSEEIDCSDIETTDNQLREGVTNRNNRIQEKYGVKVSKVAVDNVGTAITEQITANTDQFDAAMPFMMEAVTLAQNGALYDLHEFGDYIHLEAPWWDQSANETLSIADKLYFTTGDISIMQKIVSSCLLFNRSLYEDKLEPEYGDLYQLVRDKKWTMDTMVEMCKKVTEDQDGVAGLQYTDNWGIVGTDNASGYYVSGGFVLVDKDADDIPQIAIGRDEASINYAQKLLQLFADDGWFFNTQSPTQTTVNGLSIWETAMAAFAEERAMFYGAAFSAVKKLRNYGVSNTMGFIPMPLSSELQEEYCTPSNIRYAYGVCIPLTVTNPEFSAFMIEALSCYAKDDITPAYYDVTLLDRDAHTEDNVDMLNNYIFSNVVYDPGILYGFGGLSSMIDTLMSKGSADVASELESIRDAANAAIEECVEAYQLG